MIKVNVLFVIVLCLSSVWPHYTRRLDDGRLLVCQPDYWQVIRDGKSYSRPAVCWAAQPDSWLLIIADNWLSTFDDRSDSVRYGDLHRDGVIDYRDVAVLARHWPRREPTGLAAVAKVLQNEWMCK